MSKAEKQHLKEKGLLYPCTDLGNSDRLVSQHRHELKCLWEEKGSKKWIAWDGTRWNQDIAQPLERAKATARRIYDEAKECENTLGQKELTTWAWRSQAEGKLWSMLNLSSEALGVSIQEFDNAPNVINCPNGLVDLQTGELVAHTPDQLVMKRTEVNYRPDAKCPAWEQFLGQVFLQDRELIDYVQRALGYSLTGGTKEHCMFIAYGLGANGKTTMFETVLRIMGDYAKTIEFDVFLNTDKSNVRALAEVGRLKGNRFALASETGNTRQWNEALVKKITGGNTLSGTKLYGDSYEFRPSHKIWFECNHLPAAKDATHGFWRRVKVIPFRHKVEGKAKDADLRDRLWQEREGIFAWLVRGAADYLKNGLGELPPVSEEATQAYRNDNDVLRRFIAERLERTYGAKAGVQTVYDAYLKWCFDNNEDRTIPLRFFRSNMAERDVLAKEDHRKGWEFQNYQLREAKPELADWANNQPQEANDNWKSFDPEAALTELNKSRGR